MGTGRPVVPDHLLRPAAEVALAVARRRRYDDPPVPAPRRLEPFLGFARLPERALAPVCRVLDDDEDLRQATRQATTEEAVGRASWLFLERPEGWEDELEHLAGAADEVAGEAREQRAEAELRRRLQVEEQARRRADEEAAGLRRQVAEVREQLASERRLRRRAESDAGRLRREVSDLHAEVDERRRAEIELRRELEEATSTLVPEDGPEPAGRTEEEHDRDTLDRRHLEEVVARAAAAGEVVAGTLAELRRLLVDRPEEEERRGDAVTATVPPEPPAPPHVARRPAPLPPGTFDDSVGAAEHLVRLPGVLVLVDGYNVTKLGRPELSLSEQRSWLVDAARESAARTGARFDLVFDGAGERASAPADLGRRVGVQLRFSPEGTDADDLLLDLAAATSASRPLVVASDDGRVRAGARALGANVITSPQLLAVLGRPL